MTDKSEYKIGETVTMYKINGQDYRLDNIFGCTQCGKCTGICTGSELDKSYNPRQMVHLESLRKGSSTEMTKKLLETVDPSKCFQCYSCNICPSEVYPGAVMKSLREIDKDRGVDNKHIGLLKENLLQYGQSIVPEIFDGAEKIWGTSWIEVTESEEYLKDKPQKREISKKVIDEINYCMCLARS